MLRNLCLIFLFILALGSASAEEVREVYRIRVDNSPGGAVGVSTTGGAVYVRVGTVEHPAARTAEGFLASIYASPGTVVATAVHGIRLKVGGAKDCTMAQSRLVSIVPKEFWTAPKGFGGHDAGTSGILTNIPTGTSIFRNFAPLSGNPVYLEKGGEIRPLPAHYSPAAGDVLVIVVRIPLRYPKEIVLENKTGGSVEVVYPDGSRESVARVERPVKGVGRFDACGYTGVGRINTNHSGVVTISTAPIVDWAKDGSGVETRGGFMIQPSRHAKTVRHDPQVMVVGPLKKGDPWLEGAPPLFQGMVGLAYVVGDEDRSFLVEMKTADGDWMPFPPMVGRNDDALMNIPGGGSVAAIRIRCPRIFGGD